MPGRSLRKDLPGIDELKAAGLLDPVDDAFEALAVQHYGEDDAESEAVEHEQEESGD